MSIVWKHCAAAIALASSTFLSASAWLQSAPKDEAGEQENADSVEEGWFPEFAEETSALFKLEEALAESLASSLMDGGNTTKGMFQRAAAWSAGQTLEVCFVSGTPDQRREIVSVASEWNFDGSPLTLDFGSLASPRQCSRVPSDIQVKVTAGPSWSRIGSYSRSSDMVLGLGVEGGLTLPKRRQIILHEFGHALGLRHELKHADGDCWNEFRHDRLKVFYLEKFGISSEQKIMNAIGSFDPVEMRRFVISTAFDPESVMMYSFPEELYHTGRKSPCWAPVNSELSPGDRATLIRAYESPMLTASRIASLSAGRGDDIVKLANAYNSVILAGAGEKEALVSAADRLPADASSQEVADVILERSQAFSISTFGQH